MGIFFSLPMHVVAIKHEVCVYLYCVLMVVLERAESIHEFFSWTPPSSSFTTGAPVRGYLDALIAAITCSLYSFTRL